MPGQDRNVTTEKPSFAPVAVHHPVATDVLTPGNNEADHRERQKSTIVRVNVLDVLVEPNASVDPAKPEQPAPF
jgi:hypothetical protein